MRVVTGWIVAHLARWLPHRAATGLLPLGRPDADSVVLVTGNFTLTVNRVLRALAGSSAWLLVANSEGINVWCASVGGGFNEHRIIDAIKVSRLSDRVSHREVILPPLAAAGVDRRAVERETGFRCRFGPVFARDIPAYLGRGKARTDAMCRFDFGLRHRLDMFGAMNVPLFLLVAVLLAIIAPTLLLGFTVLYWAAVALLYAGIDLIPGQTGWGQSLLAALLVVTAWAGIDWYSRGNPLAHWGWLVATVLVFFAVGFDIAGTLSPRGSDAERLLQRLGCRRLGSLLVETSGGRIMLDRATCRGCLTCVEICPVGALTVHGKNHTAVVRDQALCFACGACVKQCLHGALSLGSG